MNSHIISKVFDTFPKLNALIIGDVMIDAYLLGTVNRISPEAPVPIISMTHTDHRLGGAANVALNVKALGANPILYCLVGDDANAQILKDLMDKHTLPTTGIFVDPSRPTTIKTRVMSQQQQILRMDNESTSPLNDSLTAKITQHILSTLNTHTIDVIIFEDYDKGMITPTLIKTIVDRANQLHIPTAVDPKYRNFSEYKNVTLFKPNLKELCEGLHIKIDPSNAKSLYTGYKSIHTALQCENVLITLSQYGVYIAHAQKGETIAAHPRKITDVSGAGDTVISVISLCIAAGAPALLAAKLANLAGGMVCEQIGVVPIDGNLLKKESLRIL